MKLWFVGDLHGKSECAREIMDKSLVEKPDAIIQVGDFGIRWGGAPCNLHKLFTKYSARYPDLPPWYTCGGNHDNWNKWNSLANEQGGKLIELAPKCYYVLRSNIIELENKKILFMGGAISTDAHHRTANENYWIQELPSPTEIELFKERVSAADVIVTHDCPAKIKLYDSERTDLYSKLLNSAIPKEKAIWFFGHHHMLKAFEVGKVFYGACGLHGEFLELNDNKINFYFTPRNYRANDFKINFKKSEQVLEFVNLEDV